VYGPDGRRSTSPGTMSGSDGRPDGTHTIRLTYSNTIGGEFTGDGPRGRRGNPAPTPPTVRVTDGIGGNLLLAGRPRKRVDLSADGANAKVVAQARATMPSSLDIHAEQLAVDSMDVSGRHGHRSALGRPPRLTVSGRTSASRTRSYSDSPGEPITADEQTPFGAFETRTSESGNEHQVVETYTGADGTTTVQSAQPESSRPGELPDRNLGHQTCRSRRSTTPPMSLPLTMTAPPAVDRGDRRAEIVFGPTDMTRPRRRGDSMSNQHPGTIERSLGGNTASSATVSATATAAFLSTASSAFPAIHRYAHSEPGFSGRPVAELRDVQALDQRYRRRIT